ncbi:MULTISPECIES: fumarylacetoacetate hydrolase family protein [Micromonospora]|uniref:fumarylacetoacetate hydrolase family protein n=1 Tax=Micromonospora TaxID=1873 RepID=UPI0034DFE7E3
MFAKLADALVGASDDIELRPSSTVDGEAELAVVIDKTARAADEQRTIDTPARRRRGGQGVVAALAGGPRRRARRRPG